MATAEFEEETDIGAEGLGPMRFTPHDYQIDAFLATSRALESGLPSALVVMPTGTGKTLTFMMLARQVIEDAGRVLVLAHTGELIEQAVNKADFAGMPATIERADLHARPDFTRGLAGSNIFGESPLDPKLVIATVQTMQGKRLRAWPPGHFDLIVIDEGHHAEAQTYRNVVDHLKPRWTVGFTATADRGDGKPICGANQVFERCTFEYHLHDAVRNGFLKRPVAKVLDTTIDLSSLRIVGAKDLNEKEIEELLLPHVSEICNELKDKLVNHRAVIFTPMVASADAIATALCSLGISAVSVSGEDEDRASIFRDFREGRYQHIVNAMLCTEGWDEPFVDSAVILRPTRSRALYVQMAGRALRKYEGKPEGFIWGLNWKTHGHDLVHPVEIFDSPSVRINPEIKLEAAKLVDSGEEVDLALALRRAQAERKERRRIAMQVKASRGKAVEYSYDPLGVRAEDVMAGAIAAAPPQKLDALATERQVEALVKMGIRRESAVSWSKARASGFIGEQAERREKGLCTYKQQLLLKGLGHPNPRGLAFAEASGAIDRMRRGLPIEATT